MKMEMNRQVLENMVKKIEKVVPKKAAQPILQNIKMTIKNDTFYMEGTNSDLYVMQNMEADQDELLEIEDEGSVAVPGKQFASTICLMTDKTITLEADGHSLCIRGKKKGNKTRSKMTLNGVDPAEYPKANREQLNQLFVVSGKNLKEKIHKTSYAVSKMETRPVLTGVLFSTEDDDLSVTATDSHRLSEINPNVDMAEGKRFVVPGNTLQKITSYMEGQETWTVSQDKNENHFVLESEGIYLQSRLLEGNYPDTSRLISKETKTVIDVNREEFLQSLRLCNIMPQDDSGNEVVHLTMNDDNIITLQSRGNNVGQSEEVLEAIERDGENLDLSFNVLYMIEAMQHMEGEQITLYFNGSMKPIIIREHEKYDHVQLILPVRTY